ncbi:DUF1385 domain-containing protein [Clostridium sp. MSJ-11]|uniref:DUF1385 domain-containing protein n=1 Tax=Clostridium mobile TaxID=2841512 RepID=A0ABS6ELM8_9CLOT|nr:DUF1385 domain-containing protein [Clostridium mobile]MBU5486136.1 DUF1385 domain-containing protein [Clostridium mobile]
MKKNCSVGGQALIEGVMMRGKEGIATAVRKSDGEIVVTKEDFKPYSKRNKILALPIIRGFVSLIESLIIGMKSLNYSASFFEDEVEESKFDKWFQGIFKEKSDNIIMGFSFFISIIISITLFIALPNVIANLFKKTGIENTVMLNIIEGLIRVTLFVIYILVISRMEEIRRVFEYHGAEHKAIFCYENGDELTPEKAKQYSRLHPRCGTNFMFLVMIVSIMLFSLVGWQSLPQRIIYRLLLLPVVSGITYEIIKWMGRGNSLLSRVMAMPGLALQKITTNEPDLSQLEVAIKSLKVAEGIEDNE